MYLGNVGRFREKRVRKKHLPLRKYQIVIQFYQAGFVCVLSFLSLSLQFHLNY